MLLLCPPLSHLKTVITMLSLVFNNLFLILTSDYFMEKDFLFIMVNYEIIFKLKVKSMRIMFNIKRSWKFKVK